MKKLATLLGVLSSAFLLSSTLLYAQMPAPGVREQPRTVGSGQIQWVRNYSDAVAMSQSTSKPILILFTGTSWCPACMRLEKEVLTHPQFAQAVGQKFVFLKAEIPAYDNMAGSPYQSLMDRYGINQFPTIVVVNPNGQQLFSLHYREGGPQVYTQELLQKLGGAAHF